MTDPVRPLDLARTDLARRVQEANARDEDQERAVLAHLAAVADMVCRIGDHPDGAHYRASKAGPLLDAAINVQRECFKAYAGDADAVATDQLERAHDVLGHVADALRSVMWSVAARGGDGLGSGRRRRAATGRLGLILIGARGWRSRRCRTGPGPGRPRSTRRR